MENTQSYSVCSKVDFGNPGGKENHLKRCLKGVNGADDTTGGGEVGIGLV
jgi:hypothetical protein